MFACVCVVPLAAVVFASTHMCVADTRNPWSLFVLGWCHAHTHLCCRTKLHRYSRKSVMTCRLVVLVCDRLHAHVYVRSKKSVVTAPFVVLVGVNATPGAIPLRCLCA